MNNKYLIILSILTIIAVCLFMGHYNEILLDFGREVYYPERILDGKILYKDLFNIYGPFSYLWNALLYKIFGIRLNTLYFSGGICSLLVVNGVYLVAKRYLSEILSFSIGIFTIVVGVCAVNLFSYTFPYSWGMIYGLVAFIYSLLFLIKFQQDNKNSFLYLSAFLAGISVTNKYDFLPYIIILLFFVIKTWNWKIVLKSLVSLFIIPVLSWGILFMQGLTLDDVVNYLIVIKNMSKTETLKYFYLTQGVYFNKNAVNVWILNFIKTGLTFVGTTYGMSLYDKKKVFSEVLIFVSICFAFLFVSPVSFSFLILLLVFMTLFCFKNNNLLLLVLGIISVSLKSFWGLSYINYGNYFLPLVLVAFFAILFSLISKKYQKITSVYIFTVAFAIFLGHYTLLKKLNYCIETPKGKICTHQKLAESTNILLNYINDSFDEDSKFVIYPEGLIVNFLSDRKSEDFYNSMLPLYIETFGEANIIKYLKQSKTEYIIFNNKNMKDYYFEYICSDYALDLCSFVQDNYTIEKFIQNDSNYMIFKLTK